MVKKQFFYQLDVHSFDNLVGDKRYNHKGINLLKQIWCLV